MRPCVFVHQRWWRTKRILVPKWLPTPEREEALKLAARAAALEKAAAKAPPLVARVVREPGVFGGRVEQDGQRVVAARPVAQRHGPGPSAAARARCMFL